ncbi:uncharacterized protein LACBIDRAFT_307555 [Laccaria bicolor S238N-H82]|uniref:Predicted protein n=1 Tax=Laccaria bicolor (strain S238N-H82 / ATCC MYA-4686) TaxID=486041 RepID=B0DQE8_LACBS|nr:uncharacterized protein LACBIDRAFT_307555 [Laccaria bicolor S238N-H82]EDR03024.1 predicted protein [Laccaria bicolor S238N-H82]|eukprot:XP_001886165.1 predicted protein [Laccaria bicolor S238N-H82]
MNSISLPDPCLTAQTIRTGPVDPDVGGIAVGVSNISINILLRTSPSRNFSNVCYTSRIAILLRWSGHDLKTSIFMLLSQVYPILIATASSIGSEDLSLFDAHYAVAVTASPITVYLVYSSFRDLFLGPNILFQKLMSSKAIVRYLGLMLPFLWLFVSLMTSFYTKAFRNSPLCRGMTLSLWTEFQLASNFIGVLDVMGKRDLIDDIVQRGGLGTVSLLGLWIYGIYLVRHRRDIFHKYQTWQNKSQHLPTWKRIFLTVWYIPMACWFVVTKSHPWMIFLVVFCFHWSWCLGIARGLTFDGYQFNYGQVTSVFSIIPPFLAVGELLVQRSSDIFDYFKGMPRYFCTGVRFLLTGRPNSREQDLLETRRASNSWSPLQWLGVLVVWLSVSGLQAAWILGYVEGGSKPNLRNIVTAHHKLWKPFSISLYVNGYMVCVINILVWTSYFEHVRWWKTRETMAASPIDKLYKTSIKYMKRTLHLIIVLPIAFAMCAGPLFAPFAGLPLAQQYQWTHVCDSFAGEAIIQSPSLGSSRKPLMSFYYPQTPDSTAKIHYFDYVMANDPNATIQTLSFAGAVSQGVIPADLWPDIQSVSIASPGKSNSISAQCATAGNSSMVPVPCMTGTYQISPYLNFSLQDSGNTTYLRAVDEEWQFVDDAPSFVLRYSSPDPHQPLGGIAIQTAVTERNHCEVLKVCLGSRKLGFDILAPLGVAFISQNNFAAFCTQPRIYNL